MRQEFIQTKSRKIAMLRTPWACRWVKVENGYRAFESISDYRIFMGAS